LHADGSARLTHLRLLDFRDGYYIGRGLLASTATVSTVAAIGRAAFFTGARLGLAWAAARFATAFPRVALDSFLALGRAFAPFLFWTLDDCFLRLAMIAPLVGAPQMH
jgi:hypothetical protein